jgi:phosphate transport system substrate-binding protein
MKISAAVLITAMICVPVTATIVRNDTYSLNVAGSTTVQPLMMELQREFEKFANVDMNVTGGGSGVGISSTLNGIAHIGMLSRDLTESEEKLGLDVHIIALDAVIVVLNASLNINNLSIADLANIYSGEYTNWNKISSGINREIAVVAREKGSGTRDCFENALREEFPNFEIKDRGVYSVSSTNAVLSAVSGNSGAIGYININKEKDIEDYNVKKITVDGIEAKPATIVNKTYKISRDLTLVTKGEPKGMPKFFIDWIMSREGQDIVERSGFVRVDYRIVIEHGGPGLDIELIPDEHHTGQQITSPKPTVKWEGHTLREGIDLRYIYGTNIGPGTGSVTIELRGVYSGSVTVNFNII